VHQNIHTCISFEGSGIPVAHKLHYILITGWLSNISGKCISLFDHCELLYAGITGNDIKQNSFWDSVFRFTWILYCAMDLIM